MKRQRAGELERLLSDVEWGFANGLDRRELSAMLKKLIQRAPAGSYACLFAQRKLAELVVEEAPWQAALLARTTLAHEEDDRAWAVLGLAHTLLGNFRCAVSAYRRALAMAPDCPWYSHNMGHLLDAALDRPREALAPLRLAYRSLRGDVEAAGSLAHALARCGRVAEAKRILSRALGSAENAEDKINEWLSARPISRAKQRPAREEPAPARVRAGEKPTRPRKRRSPRPPGDKQS